MTIAGTRGHRRAARFLEMTVTGQGLASPAVRSHVHARAFVRGQGRVRSKASGFGWRVTPTHPPLRGVVCGVKHSPDQASRGAPVWCVSGPSRRLRNRVLRTPFSRQSRGKCKGVPVQHIEELDLFDFSLPTDKALAEQLEGWNRQARAHCTRSKRHARRSASEANLAEILPPEIEEGDAWHVLSSGDVDSLSFVAHIVKNHVLDYVAFSTWCMAINDVEQLNAWIDEGRIKRLDAYVGEIFPGSYSREHGALCSTARATGGRVCVFRNHSKVFLLRSGVRAWVVESSANINTNPRTENTCITADSGLFDHHKRYFDSIRSFDREFDKWKPFE